MSERSLSVCILSGCSFGGCVLSMRVILIGRIMWFLVMNINEIIKWRNWYIVPKNIYTTFCFTR